MEKLWKKEVDHASFVNLFASAIKIEKEDDEWENLSSFESRKDNHHSTELRMKGNVKFRQGFWAEALEFFNQSLCFAEINSENVALAYANRLECFFRMEKYQETLIDIEMAMASKVPIRLKQKLEKIKQKSMTSNKNRVEIGKYSKSEIELSFTQHKNYSCIANVLDIKFDPKFGRHLIAKCDISVGETILIEEDFVSMRIDDELVCSTCFKPKMNFIACADCTDAVFCNSDCMKRNLTHKWECGTFFAQLHYRMKFQIQAIFMAIETFSTVECLMEFVKNVLLENPDEVPPTLYNAQSKYHFFFKLNKSAPFLPQYLPKINEIYKHIMMLPKIRCLFDTEEKQRFLIHLVLHHFLVIKTNSIISKSPWSTISVFNVLSMLNHSCAPNVYHPRIGQQQYCVTIRPVKKGEQLFISYLLLNSEYSCEKRREKFLSSWGFICRCENCHPINKSIDTESLVSDECFQFVIEHFNTEGNSRKLTVLMNNCIIFLNKYGHLQWSSEMLMIITIFVILYIEMLSCEFVNE